MSKSAAQLLDETNDAISRCLTAQSYALPDQREKHMAELSQLQKLRESLMKELNETSTSSSGMSSVGMIDRPR